MYAHTPLRSSQLPQTSVIKSKFRPMWINHMAKKRQSRAGAASHIAASAEGTVFRNKLRELREGVKNVISRGDSGKGGAAGEQVLSNAAKRGLAESLAFACSSLFTTLHPPPALPSLLLFTLHYTDCPHCAPSGSQSCSTLVFVS